MTTDGDVTIIHSLDEIPQFASEDEEADYWETHELSVEVWRSLPRVPDELLPPVRAVEQPPHTRRATG
jgi:hypothetical protein